MAKGFPCMPALGKLSAMHATKFQVTRPMFIQPNTCSALGMHARKGFHTDKHVAHSDMGPLLRTWTQIWSYTTFALKDGTPQTPSRAVGCTCKDVHEGL